MPAKSRFGRLTAVVVVCVAGLAVGAYLLVARLGPIFTGSGCRAGTHSSAVPLDKQQAAVAATIAGVASQESMPPRAVTVAYAAGLQESKLHNLGYGDRDSVGIFQQRPSEGWGPARKLRDPVYATTQFFTALAAVHGYRRMPIYRAAQEVQRSADGYAYIQYQPVAARLTTAFTGRVPHAVWCWSARTDPGKPRLAAARRQLAKTFGPAGNAVTAATASAGDARVLVAEPGQRATGWAMAAWLVTHASAYHLRSVRYAGFEWRAPAGSDGWRRVNGANPAGEVEAS